MFACRAPMCYCRRPVVVVAVTAGPTRRTNAGGNDERVIVDESR